MTAPPLVAPGGSGGGLDAERWVRRWERQQACYVPERDATFALMLDLVERLGAAPGRLLDLGCGPGCLADRAVRRWPRAEVYGVDLDPVLLELGRRTVGDGVRWLETDLRDPAWARQLGGVAVDAAVSATALHWLGSDELGGLARTLASHVRRDGVVVNYDTMPLDASTPRLQAVIEDLRNALAQQARARTGAEDWARWWDALAEEPELAERFTARSRRLGRRRVGSPITLPEYVEAFRDAGFREVALMKQVADRRLVVAIR